MPAVERVKLRMKIGAHEFEADGPRDVVMAQADTWMRAAGVRPTPALHAAAATPGSPNGTSDAALSTLFRIDAERRLPILRVQLTGRRPNADAALLLLHAFDRCLGGGDGAEAPAARLRTALAASGHRPQRLDRSLAAYVAAGLIRKGGSHKHETYSLTASGTRRAAALARQVAPPPVVEQSATTMEPASPSARATATTALANG